MIEAPLVYDGARRPHPSVELLWSPARPTLQVASALDRVRRAPTILEAMRLLGGILPVVDSAVEDGVDSDAILEPILEAVTDESDTVTGLAAVHALARVPGVRAELELAELIIGGASGFEQHALWAAGARPAAHLLLRPVARAVARGGLSGMHAQRALAHWAASAPEQVTSVLHSVLEESTREDARRYLTETIGLVPGRLASTTLELLAIDDQESLSVRMTAAHAFVERVSEPLPRTFAGLTAGELGPTLRSVRAQRQLRRRGPRRRPTRSRVRIAQIHLGEAGGLATLLPQLGEALAGQQRLAEPLTIVRAGAPHEVTASARGERLDTIELARGEGGSFTDAWPSLVAAGRGVHSAFLAGPLPDLVHLRMADPGTYAGASTAASLGIPLVFTLAPDPHGPVAAAEAAGTLERRSFAAEDGRSAVWFRASLVERLAREAREVVLFPREELDARIAELTGVDLAEGPPRHTVVAEGIDTARIDKALVSVATDTTMPPVLAELQRAIGAMSPDRHGLPLVVSAGRMVETKGMARLVDAFARDHELSAAANLAIIGGDLADPGPAEAAELRRVRRVLDDHPGLAGRVVLLGRRGHDEVALLLAAARHGWRSLIGPGGSYACASSKEEFGLAVVEALAAGLPVTAPLAGGPATYVEHGRTGSLVDTTDPLTLAAGIRQALDLASDPATAERTRATVDGRYTLERMARTLAAVYRVTTGATTLATPVAVPVTAV